jgi:hypothetical protein
MKYLAIVLGVLAIYAYAAIASGLGLIAIYGYAATLEPTPEQRSACLPDALRLCIRTNPDGSGTATLDDAGLVRCMREHKSQLSRACREAFR